MSKLNNDLKQLMRRMLIVEQYNNFHQLGAQEDITYINGKILNIPKITNTEELIKELKWVINIVDSYFYEVDKDFIKAWEAQRMKEFT